MKRPSRQFRIVAALSFGASLRVVMVVVFPPNPTAFLRVVDEAGVPISGAVIQPEGLRTKPGPYISGWYGWRTETNGGVANPPVATDKEGYARIPYPRHVFERIETGTLCLMVRHPDYVTDRPERVVATTPPAGAPWQDWINELAGRIRLRTLVARPDPVILKKGAELTIKVDDASAKGRLTAQISRGSLTDTNFWTQPQSGMLVTHQLPAGPHMVRAVKQDPDGTVWFSDVVSLVAVAKQTNALAFKLRRGATVRGALDSTVPRPVRNGRAVAHVWPLGCVTKESPPQWHGWATVNDAGEFAIPFMPEGDLEIVALCDGFISTNGPGQFQTRYPQRHRMGTNDLQILVGMEPTARLEVRVFDNRGTPLKDVRVGTWPNVRYGEWSSVLLMADCYNSADLLFPRSETSFSRNREVWDYNGLSDATGLAVLPNVPTTVKALAADHPEFTLPAIQSPDGGKHRYANIKLVAGATNQMSLQLERRGKSPITHY